MNKKSNFPWRLWLPTGLVVPVFLAGCLSGGGSCGSGECGNGASGKGLGSRIDKCATIPAGAIPQPIGTHTNEILSRQVAKAEADQFVIYLYEWSGDTANFGPFGARHVDRMATRLNKAAQPVVIEADVNTSVNEARRLTMVAYLEQRGVANASQLVTIGFSQAEGLYGDEADRAYRQMIWPQGNSNIRGQGFNQNGFRGGGLGTGGGGGIGGFGGF